MDDNKQNVPFSFLTQQPAPATQLVQVPVQAQAQPVQAQAQPVQAQAQPVQVPVQPQAQPVQIPVQSVQAPMQQPVQAQAQPVQIPVQQPTYAPVQQTQTYGLSSQQPTYAPVQQTQTYNPQYEQPQPQPQPQPSMNISPYHPVHNSQIQSQLQSILSDSTKRDAELNRLFDAVKLTYEEKVLMFDRINNHQKLAQVLEKLKPYIRY